MQKLDGVICGHIHRAEIKSINGVQYLNCGDWVESCTALVEDFEGSIRLIHFNENHVLYSGRKAGTPDASDSGARDDEIARPPSRGRVRRRESDTVVAELFPIFNSRAGGNRADY
jgi:hypothetical protein